MVDVNDKLIVEMEKAEHALTVHGDGLITKEVLNSCIQLVEKGRALELFLDFENKLYFESNSFLHNKCLELSNKGASVFFIPENTDPKFWKCLVDFKVYSYYSLQEGSVLYHEEKDVPFYQEALIDFENKRQNGKPLSQEKNDIKIRLRASEQLIMMGDTIELFWEVDGAEKVIIQGLGKVDAYGRKKIQLEKDTIIKIGASNPKQSQIKALLIKVSDENMKIPYDIEFLNTATKDYSSLVNSDIHPHVYGISKGNQVRLTWKVLVAAKVKIMPFNISGNSGEYIFTPTASQNIEIHATIKEKTFVRKIQLLLFPIPLFRENLVPFSKLLYQKYELFLPLDQKENTRKIQAIENKRYKELNEKIMNRYSKTSSKKINIKAINNFVFGFLTNKHSERKGIFNEIKSIQSYYERPSSESGTDKSSL